MQAKLEHLFEPFPEVTRGIPFPTEYFTDREAIYAMMDAIENAKKFFFLAHSIVEIRKIARVSSNQAASSIKALFNFHSPLTTSLPSST
jgi:hypothetical protein